VKPSDHNHGTADQQRSGEEHSAGLGKPKPATEPSPIAPEFRHSRSLGQRTNGTRERGGTPSEAAAL
jgi:hypothetical protein